MLHGPKTDNHINISGLYIYLCNYFLAGQNVSGCSRNSLNFMRKRNQCETAHLDICTFNAIVGAKVGGKARKKMKSVRLKCGQWTHMYVTQNQRATKAKKKNNSHCSYRDKRQEEKGPGQDLCLKCCLSCRPMNETAIGSVQGRWPAPTAGAKNFRNDGRKAEKCGEKRF